MGPLQRLVCSHPAVEPRGIGRSGVCTKGVKCGKGGCILGWRGAGCDWSWAMLLGMEHTFGPQRALNAKAKCLSVLKSGSSLGGRHGGDGSCLKGGAILSPDCQMSGETCISPTSLQCLETLKTTEWESPVHQKVRDPILLMAHGSCAKNTDGYRWAKAQKEDQTLSEELEMP